MDEPRKHRNTRQRQAVWEELSMVTSHPTAVELYERVRRRLPKISLGTVYRNLDLLSRGGLVQKLDLGGTEARFDANTHEHAHLRCVRCGRVDDVEALPLGLSGEAARRQIGSRTGGYQILGFRFEYVGICPDCASKANRSEGKSPTAFPPEPIPPDGASPCGTPPHGQEASS